MDIVLEQAGKVAGVEIKAASTVTKEDFRGLAKLKETIGDRFVAGVVMMTARVRLALVTGSMPSPSRRFGRRTEYLKRFAAVALFIATAVVEIQAC